MGLVMTAEEWKKFCDQKQLEYDAETLEQIKLTGNMSIGFIRQQLRRMSGFTGHGIGEHKAEFDHSLSGKAGWRGCGPAAWDNAVRAAEEDR